MRRSGWLLLPWLVVVALVPVPPAAAEAPAGGSEAVSAVLDDWHAAASEADEDRYFGHFTADAVFLGTAAEERWTVEGFRAYAHPHFSAGRGWTYRPHDRHVMISGDGRLAWFDERLSNDKYGELRGTGVLRRTEGGWKIVHYNMTFTIPNEKSREVVELIGGGRP